MDGVSAHAPQWPRTWSHCERVKGVPMPKKFCVESFGPHVAVFDVDEEEVGVPAGYSEDFEGGLHCCGWGGSVDLGRLGVVGMLGGVAEG